jgi:hypothetical protein
MLTGRKIDIDRLRHCGVPRPETSNGCGHPVNLPRRAHFALHLISVINDEFGLNGIADGTQLKDFPAAADLMS